MKINVWLTSLLLLLFLSFQKTQAQRPQAKIDFEDPEIEFLERLVRKKINAFRVEQGLHALKYDSVLILAAKNQTKYNYKTNSVGNVQASKKSSSAFLRVNKSGGNHALVDETDVAIVIGEKTKVKGIKGRQVLKTYEDAATAIASEWTNVKNEVAIVKNPEFYNIGIAVLFVPDEKVIFASAVFASEPYIKISGVKYSNNSYKISPYSSRTCRIFEREYGYLPELFSTALSVENGQIVFKFHDLTLMKSILETNKDKLAVDIVQRSQFDCPAGNRDHPSPVEHGILLKPVKKGKLLKKNPLKEEKQFSAILGEFPSQLNEEDVELNLVVVKDKCNCKTVKYNNIDSKNLRLLNVDFAIDTLSISENIDSLSRDINFQIPFEKNKSEYQVEDIKPILDSIQLNRFDIKQINIVAYSSIEGNVESNEILQKKRAESILSAIQQYQLQKVKRSITTFENWEGFYKSIEDSPYADQYKGKSKDEVRALINSDTLGYDLEPYLEGQRKAEINVKVESIYIDSLTPALLPNKFSKAIKDNEHIIAKGIQTLMVKNVDQGKIDQKHLFPDNIPYLKENMPIMNNIVAFKYKYYGGNDLDSLFESLKSDVTRFFGIDPSNPHLNYNKQLVELYYWSRNIHYLMIDKEAKINQPKDLYKAIRRLYNTKIDNWKVNQLMLNYHLIAADFYYETQDYKMREKSLKAVKKLILKSKLNMEQTFVMAGYFTFQIHIDWAIEIMLPFIKKNDFDEDFIFRLISIAVYDEDLVPEERFLELLDQARKMNPSRYCELFGAPNMSFQLLENRDIKNDYCTHCK